LTHRDHAQSVTFVTGHKKDGSIDLDWPALTRPDQTVVVYMGLTMAADLCAPSSSMASRPIRRQRSSNGPPPRASVR
jgi:siroheme synthase